MAKGQADGGSMTFIAWVIVGGIFLLVLLYILYTSSNDASTSVLDKLFGARK